MQLDKEIKESKSYEETLKTARTYEGFSKIKREKLNSVKRIKKRDTKNIYGEILKIVREMEGKNKEKQTV